MPSGQDLRAARLVSSATLRAWSEMTLPIRTARFRLSHTTLAQRALDVIAKSREEGTRDKVPQEI